MNYYVEKRARITDDEFPLDLSCKPASSTTLPNIFSLKKKQYNNDRQQLKQDDTENSTIISVSLQLSDIPSKLLTLEIDLTQRLETIKFQHPVEYIYSPIIYAKSVHWNFLKKFCENSKKILFLGMNPGPWGMSQTGVPFGERNIVVDWLKLSGIVNKPTREQPQRRVTGFDCKRSEVSGRRFWSVFRTLCNNPENFFRHCFLRNYCSVALMDAGGRNITPAELKGLEKKAVQDICDLALVQVIQLLQIKIIIAIGRFTEQRAKNVVKTAKLATNVLWMSHPSPRATGREKWSDVALKFLQEQNLLQFFVDKNLSVDQGVS